MAQLDSLNTGMPLPQARRNIAAAIEFFRYFSGWCTKINGIAHDVRMTGGLSGLDGSVHAYTIKEPVGVVGLIVPWNGPAFNAAAKLAPSLAAGCSSVLKPAEETPLSALIFEKILAEAGVPDGVVNLVNGYGHTTGQALIEHPEVDKIAFTGSTEVGKLIVQAAAGNLKRVMLELGGKSPVLIYDDAELDKAIPIGGHGYLHSLRAGLRGRLPRFRATRCLRKGGRRHCGDGGKDPARRPERGQGPQRATHQRAAAAPRHGLHRRGQA